MDSSRRVSTQLLNATTSEIFFLHVEDSLTNTKASRSKMKTKKPDLVCSSRCLTSTYLQLSLCNNCLQVKCDLALWVLERCKISFPDENGNAQLSPY